MSSPEVMSEQRDLTVASTIHYLREVAVACGGRGAGEPRRRARTGSMPFVQEGRLGLTKMSATRLGCEGKGDEPMGDQSPHGLRSIGLALVALVALFTTGCGTRISHRQVMADAGLTGGSTAAGSPGADVGVGAGDVGTAQAGPPRGPAAPP